MWSAGELYQLCLSLVGFALGLACSLDDFIVFFDRVANWPTLNQPLLPNHYIPNLATPKTPFHSAAHSPPPAIYSITLRNWIYLFSISSRVNGRCPFPQIMCHAFNILSSSLKTKIKSFYLQLDIYSEADFISPTRDICAVYNAIRQQNWTIYVVLLNNENNCISRSSNNS